MLRNVATQKYRVYAWDATTGLAKTGDAANISAYIQIDDGAGAATNDTAPSEVSSTNQPGYYDFDLTQAETNGAKVSLSPKSATANIVVVACPPVIYTRAQYASLEALDSSGRGDISKFAGQTITAAAGVTLPSSVASPTNITAGTITTVTNLTNLPSIPADWITAAGIANGAIDAATFAADVDAEARGWLGLASANLDTQLADLPTVAEFEARTIVSANYALEATAQDILTDTGTTIPATLTTIASYIDTEIQTIITGLADVPTVAEFEARTLPSADYVIVSDLGTVQTGDSFAYLGTNLGALGANATEAGGTGDQLTALATQASVNDLPTNAELATALAAADDAVLAAIAALNNLSAADILTALNTSTKPANADPATWTYLESWWMLTRRFYAKVVHDADAGTITVHDFDAGKTAISEQPATTAGNVETQDEAANP